MKTFDCELMIETTVEFSTTGEPDKLYSPPHETRDIKDIKVHAYATVKAIQQALERARAIEAPDHALVPVDVFEGLSRGEQEAIYEECCQQDAVNYHSNQDH